MVKELFDTRNGLLCAGTVGGLAEATLGGLPSGGELGAIGGLVGAFVVAGIWMFRRFGGGEAEEADLDELGLTMTAPAPREPAGADLEHTEALERADDADREREEVLV